MITRPGRLVVQCHDDPDPDALASGLLVCRFGEYFNRKIEFIYSGNNPISKSNAIKMVELLGIEIRYVAENELKDQVPADILLLVDCRTGQKNVKPYPYKEIAVIDHHTIKGEYDAPGLCDIRPQVGSCVAIIWNLVQQCNNSRGMPLGVSDLEAYPGRHYLGTALYYGLFMDTNGFGFGSNLDKRLKNHLEKHQSFDSHIFNKLSRKKYSLDEMFQIAKIETGAIKDTYHVFKLPDKSDYDSIDSGSYYPFVRKDLSFLICCGEICSNSVLGQIADDLISADDIDLCVAYAITPAGDLRISVRSHVDYVSAADLAYYITDCHGGGHSVKAGGTISTKEHPELRDTLAGPANVRKYLTARIHDYLDIYKIIDTAPLDGTFIDKYYGNEILNYCKKDNLRLGFVFTADIIRDEGLDHNTHFQLDLKQDWGDNISVHKAEMQFIEDIDRDKVIMIGIDGRIYPLTMVQFLNSYQPTEEAFYDRECKGPELVSSDTGESYDIIRYAKACYSKKSDPVRAVKTHTQAYKLRSGWGRRFYISSRPGDYIVAGQGEYDIWPVDGELFDKLYDRV
ncbi:DHH family phosphoesterase [Butyrivibrio sp. MC2013]|uniref:DHH family phosphoesterase n=1 Tax=Butyrivibrio sp. MC2013 TaxID=1280686 RepID=UPI0018CB26FA|nr:DHH family phosphoesterase [Butyrivibrio sp. MC2013]